MPDTVKVMDWNIGGQNRPVVERFVRAQLEDEDTLGTWQEVDDEFITFLESLGYQTHRTGWCATSWHPDTQVYVGGANGRLSDRPWNNGRRDVYADIDLALICDRDGRSLTLGSYKLPPSIQDGGHRVDLAVSALTMLGWLLEDAKTTGVLVGADVNYDVDTGNRIEVLHQALAAHPTLRLHLPPEPTLGKRQIDVFQTIRPRMGGRLISTGTPVVAGPKRAKCHRYHVREFGWQS